MPQNVKGLCPLVNVYDMPTSLRFYRDLLGFEIVAHSPHRGGDDPDRFHWCWLRLGDAELMLNTAYEFDEERPVPPDPKRVAAHKDLCFFVGCPDIDGAYEELRAKGVNVKKPKIAPYGMKQMNLSDPDSYGICFQWQATSEEIAQARA
jgi:catechol 2,3-dioxygenase-like lactoylglutathione lyase family enzyme